MYRRIRDNFPVAIKKIAKAKIASLYHGVPLEVLLLQKVTKYPVPAYRVPCTLYPCTTFGTSTGSASIVSNSSTTIPPKNLV